MKRNIIFPAGLGNLVGQLSSEALIMTRILSAFKLLKRVGFGVLLLGANVSAFAQAPDTLWTRVVSDIPIADSTVISQEIYSLAETESGSIVGVGFSLYDNINTDDFDSLGGLVVKLDANGEFQWETFLRECGYLSGVVARSDDSIWVAGYSQHVTPTFEYYQAPFVALLDALGDTVWTRSVQIDTSSRVDNVGILDLQNGEFLVSGFRQAPNSPLKQIFLVWIDSSADTQRTRYFYSPNNREALNINVQKLSDSLVVTCDAGNCGPFCAYFFTETGDPLSAFVSPVTPCMHTTGIPLFSSTSNIFVARNYLNPGLSKISSDGSLLWHVFYLPWHRLSTPFEDSQSGLVIACESWDAGIGIVRVLDSTGQPDWENFAEPENTAARMQSVPLRLSDGGYVVAGSADYYSEQFTTILPYFVRFEAPEFDAASEFPQIPDEISLIVYPNPTNAATELSFDIPRTGSVNLSLYDVLGQKVASIFEGYAVAGARSIWFNAANLPSGIYFARLRFESHAITQKIVLIK